MVFSNARADARIVVAARGCKGTADLQKALDNNSDTVSWGLLRIEVGSGTCMLTKFVSMTCIGQSTTPVLRGKLTERTSEVMSLLGPTNASLQLTCAEECTVDHVLEQVLPFVVADHLGDYSIDKFRQDHLKSLGLESDETESEPSTISPLGAVESASTTASIHSECGDPIPQTFEECLTAIADFSGCLNWAIVEPQELSVHSAGTGGLEEMKRWFEPDKVMWGVLGVSLGGSPPIFKHVFVHWIGLKVAAVKCGQWNFKTSQVVEKVHEHLTINHKITAHGLCDLDLPALMNSLKRKTYGVQALDTASRKAIAEVRENYTEDFQEAAASLEAAVFNATTYGHEALADEVSEELQGESASRNPELAEALHCVRMPNSKWNWVLLRVGVKPTIDSTSPSVAVPL